MSHRLGADCISMCSLDGDIYMYLVGPLAPQLIRILY